MTATSEKKIAARQKFSKSAPVVNLVTTVDYIFNKLGIAESSFRTPSSQSDQAEMVAGMTNTYLQPTRIGRKALLGDIVFFYGRKFNLTSDVFETVPYDTPADVLSFVENRVKKTLTDYMSIHKGNLRLNIDVQNGKITSLVKTGFDDQFSFLSKNDMLTVGNLEKVIKSLMDHT